MKYSTLQNQLKELIPTILGLAEGEELNLQNQLIVYIFGSSGLKEDQIIAIVQKLPIKIKETVMNTLDILVEKGIKIGQEKSLQGEREKTARNLIKISTLNDEQIATATDLPVDRVISLRKEAQAQ